MEKKNKESVKKKKIKLHLLRNARVLHQIESKFSMPSCCLSSASFKSRIAEKSQYTFEEYKKLVESPYILYDNAVWVTVCSNVHGTVFHVDYSFSPYFDAIQHNMSERRIPEDENWKDLILAYGPFIDLEEAANHKTRLLSFKTLLNILKDVEQEWREGRIQQVLWHIIPSNVLQPLKLMFLPKEFNTTDSTNDRLHIPASSNVVLATSGL